MKKKYTILSITAIIAFIVFVSILWVNSSNASENKSDEELTVLLNRDYSSSSPDEQSTYISRFSEDGEHIVVEYTTDGGSTWYKTEIDYKSYLKNGGDAGEVFIDFVDQDNGYILYCSTPAAGQMLKVLFKSTDGGKSFELAGDLSGTILGYPTGIGFQSKEHGYIAFTYHGADYFLFETKDGAETWESVEPFFDESYSYIDSYPPYFYGEGRQSGEMLLKFVDNTGDSQIRYELFSTEDAGKSWTAE